MTYEEKLTERLNTYTKESLINLYLQMRFERDVYLDMYSETQKWHKTSEEKPTKEGQYLCCDVYDGEPFFKVMRWSNDSEWGCLKSSCDYWKPIDWYWKPMDWSDEDDE